MIRTYDITRCLQTVVTALCCLVVLSACSDDSADDSAQREQERKVQELKAVLAGGWNLDTDGLPEYNLTMTEYNFTDTQVSMAFYGYNYDTDGYDFDKLSYDYTVLGSTQVEGREVYQLRLTPAQETINWVNRKNEEIMEEAKRLGVDDPDLYDVEEMTDTMQLVVKDNSIGFYIAKEEIEEYQSEGLTIESDVVSFQRGAIDFASIDTKPMREAIEEIKRDLEEYNALHDGDPTSLNMSKLMAQVRRASETQHIYDNKGHELREWMKSVPDDRMLCKMMIPGAHDAGTYGMYWEWLRTLAKTQDQDIKGQWDHGIRCFDLRVRYWNNENRLYHDLISCDVTLKDVFKQVQDKLRENPRDGAIIMVKTEGNNAADLKSIWVKLANTIPLGITNGEANNKESIQETVKLVEEYFLNQTVDGHPMLAKFHPDMTMKDLRGRVVVLIQNAPSESEVNYGKLKEYLAVDFGDKYGNMLGDTRPVKVQNDWEQAGGGLESTYGYLQRKTTRFRNLLFETVANTQDSYWVYNAANGYYRDPALGTDLIPDYASYAQEAYPIFTRDIIRYGNPRGIVLMDYVGWDHFKRVSLKALVYGPTLTSALIAVGATLAIGIAAGITGGAALAAPLIVKAIAGILIGAGVAALAGADYVTNAGTTLLFGEHWTAPTFYIFWLVFKAAKGLSGYKDPKAQPLINAIVEVNFPEQHETGVSNDPIDIGR